MSKLVRISVWIPAILVLSLSCLLLYIRGDKTATTMQDKKVFIYRQGDGFTLVRNGQPFEVKGAAGSGNLVKLRETGGNTLRVWDTTNLGMLLDQAAANNIVVIAGLDMPFSYTPSFYLDSFKVNTQFRAYREIVRKYRAHPALLMWCLGNEVDFPYRYSFRHFYKAYNDLLDMIHQEDPDHPVATALINLHARNIVNIKLKVPDLDLITINSFGNLSKLQNDLDNLSWLWKGPFMITEWGISGPWESETTAWGAPIENTSTKKAEQYLERAASLPVKSQRYLGACCFYWGHKQEVTHTWYSLFSEEGHVSEVVNALQYVWTGKPSFYRAPDVRYMLIEGKGARDNILLKPDNFYSAELLMNVVADQDSLSLKWELLAEDWFLKNTRDANLKKPAALDSLVSQQPPWKAGFRAPSKEGAYRLFVTVFDKKGYFSTANTPFYVVEQ